MNKKFRNALTFAVAAVIMGPMFSGCKKGDNDPFFSFRSRAGRVEGKWAVSKGSGTSVDNNQKTTTWTYANPVYTKVKDGNTSTDSITYTYEFTKDGKFTFTEIQTENGTTSTSTVTGTWNFTDGVGDKPNKSQIILTTGTVTWTMTYNGSSSSYTSSYTGSNAPVQVYDLDKLANTEMVWKWSDSSTTGSNTSSDSGEWTLTQ